MTPRIQLLSMAVAVLAACTTPSLPAARFANAPAAASVNDRVHTPAPPAPRTYARVLTHFRGNFVTPIKRTLELPADQRALGVNALDEVPDSTWFTNRIGVRALSPDELRTGTGGTGSPEAHLPWTVLSTKVGGADIGFIITDARGEKFILKFDKLGYPEVETAADAIVSRLLWGAGYNVPEDDVVYFHAKDLILAPTAKIKDVFGNARPLHQAELDQMIAKIDRAPDGRIRGLTSHMLPGTWLGGHPGEGTRADDPNDRIAHERRRDLRGSHAVFSWLDHGDIKEDNYVDMWIADPEVPAQRYVKHFLVDFGSALGAGAMSYHDLRGSYEYIIDVPSILASLTTLGLHERDWEGREIPALPGVGLFTADQFVPEAWKPNNPTYLPFHTADRFDHFWGAKILIRFTPAQIAAAVDSGRLSDPRAAAYLTRTLIARQRAVARHWFSQVAPIDRAAVVTSEHGHAVCFDDLMLTYHLAPVAADTRYVVTTYDRSGAPLASSPPIAASPDGHSCTQPVQLAADADGYTIVELRTTRPGLDASTFVHLARDRGAVNVVGIWRQ